jgi:hypothetical protein
MLTFRTALRCPALPCPAALPCAALHCTALPCPALPCPALRCAALHCTALHCTALHCTVASAAAGHDEPLLDAQSPSQLGPCDELRSVSSALIIQLMMCADLVHRQQKMHERNSSKISGASSENRLLLLAPPTENFN